MQGRDLIIVVSLIVILGGGAVIYQSIEAEKAAVRRSLADAAERAGLDSDLVLAIGYVESRWRLYTVNLAGSDGARGGSYGPTQISAKTARAYGYTGDPMAFARDPDLAAAWTVKILRARPGGPPSTVEDAAAWWNGGAPTIGQLRNPSTNTAATDYLPKLASAYAMITTEAES